MKHVVGDKIEGDIIVSIVRANETVISIKDGRFSLKTDGEVFMGLDHVIGTLEGAPHED